MLQVLATGIGPHHRWRETCANRHAPFSMFLRLVAVAMATRYPAVVLLSLG